MTKTVLITGAANRIGAVMAKTLAAMDYQVVVHFNNSKSEADNLCKTIALAGGEAHSIQANLSNAPMRNSLIANAVKKFGPITTLINNASVYQDDSATTFTEEIWDTHFDIHAKAPVILARDFATQMPTNAIGNIINILDERVLRNHPGYFSYNLSKSVLWTATQTMAQSFAPKIRVNAIGPGPTLPHTRQSQTQFDKSVEKLPLKTSASPDDIANAVLFLLNTPSMTGQILALDGGEHLEWRGRGSTPKNLNE